MSLLDRLKAVFSNAQEPTAVRVLVPDALSMTMENRAPIYHAQRFDPEQRFAVPDAGLRGFRTQGLAALGQQEVEIVLVSSPDANSAALERDVEGVFNMLYEMARAGRIVQAGDMTLFRAKAPFGVPHSGLAYVQSAVGVGASGLADTLTAVFLHPEECPIAHLAGIYRPLAWLTHAYRAYPFPAFSDTRRASALPPRLPESVLARVPYLSALREARATLRERSLVLELALSTYDEISSRFDSDAREPMLGILTGHDSAADARAVWLPDSASIEVVGLAGSAMSRIELGFVLLAGAQREGMVRLGEDGAIAALPSAAWTALQIALKARQPFDVDLPGIADERIKHLRIEPAPS